MAHDQEVPSRHPPLFYLFSITQRSLEGQGVLWIPSLQPGRGLATHGHPQEEGCPGRYHKGVGTQSWTDQHPTSPPKDTKHVGDVCDFLLQLWFESILNL